MTIDEFVADMTVIIDYTASDFSRDSVLIAAKDLAGKISNRVIETGRLASGKGDVYSTKTTLVGRSSFLQNKQGVWDGLFSKAGSTVLKRSKKAKSFTRWATITGKDGNTYHLIILEGGYAKIRSLEGNKNTFKNYNRGGEMWSGFGVKKEEDNLIVVGGNDLQETKYAGKSATGQQLINWHSKAAGEAIIAPNKDEINEMTEYLENELAAYINNKLK